MNRKRLIALALLVILVAASLSAAFAAGHSSLAAARAATAGFHRPAAAGGAGWDLREGLDHCFDNPGVGAMGYHYINTDLLEDTTVEAEAPEALVYAPQANGKLKLAAVEYIVPAAAWDAAGHNALPALHGQRFHLNEALGVYVLHAWIWQHNPAGMFEDWNPNVSCP